MISAEFLFNCTSKICHLRTEFNHSIIIPRAWPYLTSPTVITFSRLTKPDYFCLIILFEKLCHSKWSRHFYEYCMIYWIISFRRAPVSNGLLDLVIDYTLPSQVCSLQWCFLYESFSRKVLMSRDWVFTWFYSQDIWQAFNNTTADPAVQFRNDRTTLHLYTAV